MPTARVPPVRGLAVANFSPSLRIVAGGILSGIIVDTLLRDRQQTSDEPIFQHVMIEVLRRWRKRSEMSREITSSDIPPPRGEVSMRHKTLLGSCVLAALGVTSFLTASYVVDAKVVPPSEPTQVTIIESAAPTGAPANDPGNIITLTSDQYPSATSSVRIKHLESTPGQIDVSAVFDLRNSARSRNFIWKLDVTTQGERLPVFSHTYGNQIGSSRKGTHIRPTFTERIPMLPGDYCVTVSILEVPFLGVDALSDDTVARRNLLASDTGKVSIE